MRWVIVGCAVVMDGCGGFAVADCDIGVGDLVITELAVRGESYVEVYNPADAAVELDGLTLSVAGSGQARDTPMSGAVRRRGYTVVQVRSLADDGGDVRIGCGERVVDAVQYERGSAAVVALDGARVPDAFVNDDVDAWCAQDGTPGEANAVCGGGGCDDGAAPEVEDVVIAAVCGNPDGADTGREWVALTVAGASAVQLGGLALVHRRDDGAERASTLDCQVAQPGERVVVAPEGLALYNARGTTLLLMRDDDELASLATPFLAEEGCDDEGPSEGDDCGVAAPRGGDLIVSEVLRDPEGADAGGEWLELFVAGANAVLLDGLAVTSVASSTRRWTLQEGGCAIADAGSFVLLGVDGGDGLPLEGTSGLFNGTATVEVTLGATVLDSVVIDCGSHGTSCAWVDGAWCEATPTPGTENACD